MKLYARVNILGGKSVRLPRGDIADAITLDNDPIARAEGWQEQGADVIHVVDLDAAADRDYRNRPLIDRMIANIDIPVQVAGGVRSPGEASRLIEAGAARVVMGTAAIEDQNMVWDLCRDHPDRITVSLDVNPAGEIVTRGWTTNSGRFLEEVLVEMSSAGVATVLVASAGRDALIEPPDLSILGEALETIEDPVIAAGGVRHLNDLKALLALEVSGRRLAGVIVGREVTHGRFTITEAKEVIAAGPPPAETTIETPPHTRQPSQEMLDAARAYRQAAEELDKAAAHARTAAQRCTELEMARAAAHGLSVTGHMSVAAEIIQDLARLHAERSSPQ